MSFEILVVHSGGMDSSLCLAHAVQTWGSAQVLSLSFDYGQRHRAELARAKKICRHFGVQHTVTALPFLAQLSVNALTRSELPITIQDHGCGTMPSTWVAGRNGLFARIAAMEAHSRHIHRTVMGVIGVEGASSGYPDCSRSYMDLIQQTLRIDLQVPEFEVQTPLVHMTKKETMEWGYRMGVLEDLLELTLSCYEGVEGWGCRFCFACQLRNEGIERFLDEHPEFPRPYAASRRVSV